MNHLKATQVYRKLTATEQDFVDRAWKKWFAHYTDEHGPGDASDCIKLRSYKYISNRRGIHIAGGPDKLTPGWIGFLYDHEILPLGEGELSHQCGCKLCINGTNAYHEFQNVNLGRKDCHRLIRKFEKAVRCTADAVTGKVTVDTVCTVWTDQKDICNHNPPCFVNYGCSRRK